MTARNILSLHGALGSPYSMKMRALLRYRRIPFEWVQEGARRTALWGLVKAPVIPLIEWPDGSVANDSTQLTRMLEAQYPDRGVIPDDAGHAFLAYLIEDFADEWLVKAMFGYRWLHAADAAQVSRWLLFDAMPGTGGAAQQAMADAFRERQVGRMAMVGCTAVDFPLIEDVTRQLLAILDAHVADGLFLFGTRPSEAEFALFGQLSQLASDPTPAALLRADYPLALRWLAQIDDLSGADGEWGPPGPMVEPMLGLVGAVYLPFLNANAAALKSGAATLGFSALGHDFTQPPFRYQGKCLDSLLAAYAALAPHSRATVDPLLDRTGCLDALKA